MSRKRKLRYQKEWAAGALLLCVLTPVGMCQGTSVAESEADSADAIEEVTVYGKKSIRKLRAEMYRAQDVALDQFNATNSNDEFDIHCFKEATTGSRLMRRVCRPNFVSEIVAAATTQWLLEKQSGISDSFKYPIAKIRLKEKLLQAEMEALVAANPDLARVFREFSSAQKILVDERKRRCEGRFLICRR